MTCIFSSILATYDAIFAGFDPRMTGDPPMAIAQRQHSSLVFPPSTLLIADVLAATSGDRLVLRLPSQAYDVESEIDSHDTNEPPRNVSRAFYQSDSIFKGIVQ